MVAIQQPGRVGLQYDLEITAAEPVSAHAGPRRVGIALAVLVVLTTLSVLVLGWGMGLDAFRRILPQYPAMVPLTALDILLGGLGTLALYSRAPSWIPVLFSVGIVLGVAAAVFSVPVPTEVVTRDGTSVASMAAALMLAASLCLRAFGLFRVAIVVTTVSSALVSVCILGYIFDAQALFDNPVYTKMALHTALAYFALHGALVLSEPATGWIAILLAPDVGSQMARRMLPVMVAATLLFCWMAKLAVERDLMTVEFRLALLAFMIIASTGGAVIGFAHLANLSERRSQAAEAAFLRSERRRREVELSAARAEKVEALGQLVGGVAHDFNNTLSVILGNLELLERVPDGAQRSEYLSEAIAASNRAANLTRQLLAYGRKSQLDPVPMRLDAAVMPALEMFRRVCPPNIEVIRDDGAADAAIRVDSGAFQQALLNILINARDAMPDGGRITVRFSQRRLEAAEVEGFGGAETLPPGEYVTVSVEDNGPGMSAEVAARASEPFFTTKADGEGTGLGLSTVQGFCRQSGGGLRIESTPGTGAIVTMAFPNAGSASGSGAPGGGYGNGHAVAAIRRGILIVDDDEAVTRVMVRQLELDGHVVEVAHDAEAALERLDRAPLPEIVITDIAMPGRIQLHHLARRIGQRYPGLPVLLISGYDSTSRREEIATLVDLPFLQKPINLRTLRTVVGRLLLGPRDDERQAGE